MTRKVTLIKGDGIGPEVVNACVKLVNLVTNDKIIWDEQLLGLAAINECNTPLPQATLESIQSTKVALKGPTNTPIGSGHTSANVALRKSLDLYSCIRPVKTVAGLNYGHDNVDIVIVRENTEGLYCGKEIIINENIVASLRIISKEACLKIAQAAFEFAINNNRKKVTVAHKANILKNSDALFLDCFRKVRGDFPGIEYEEMIIDALCMKMVMKPKHFDVVALENMFGDIVSDLASGLVGGLGIVPGANMGKNIAVFEAVHGSADDIAGQNLANPTAMIQSGILMLKHLQKNQEASRLEKALFHCLSKKELRTKDLGGNCQLDGFVEHIISTLKADF